MVTKASLQSSNSPSGVATNTPSCACSNSMRYFSSATWRSVVSCTTWMVPFCWLPCSAYDEVETTDSPPKHGSIPSPSPPPRSQYRHPLQPRFCGGTSPHRLPNTSAHPPSHPLPHPVLFLLNSHYHS